MTDSFRCCPECHTSWRRAVGFGKWEPGCSCGDMDTRQAWDIPEAMTPITDAEKRIQELEAENYELRTRLVVALWGTAWSYWIIPGLCWVVPAIDCIAEQEEE